MKLFVVFLQLCGLLASVSAITPGRVGLRQRASGDRAFVDEFGRELFFHGVNAVVKGPPWIPSTDVWDGEISLMSKDFDDLESLGLNVIRLGSMWPGVAPAENTYSKEYIRKLKSIAKQASMRGIYTLLDMHQDVISENYCGEGVPNWVIQKAQITPQSFPSPHNNFTAYTDVASDGFPTRADCSKFNWPQYYGTYDASKAFEALYDATDSKGLLTAWSDFWTTLATEFKDEAHILGYELINEPWAGDIFTYKKLIVPGVADRERLQPAYDKLAAAIRGVDTNTLIFFAAITWDDIVPAGFTAAPNADPASSVFAYHYYAPPQFNDGIYFHQRNEDAKRLQVGSMLTEFERPVNNNDMETDPVFKTFASADKHLQSWAMWELKTFCKETTESLNGDSQNAAWGSCKTGYGSEDYLWDANGVLNTNTTTKLARTYATAVAGNTTHMSFDHQTAEFELRFNINAQINAPTVVFAHKQLQYPNGYTVKVTPEHALSYKEGQKANTLEFTSRPLTGVDGQPVSISIKRV